MIERILLVRFILLLLRDVLEGGVVIIDVDEELLEDFTVN
jgi:hypothetical protein